MTEETTEKPTDPNLRQARSSAELELLERMKAIAGVAIAILGVCVVLGGFALTVWGRAEARTAEQLQPVEKRVGILEAQVPFILAETREVRVEQRALASKGASAPELSRPMAPLPAGPDGGP